LKEGESAAQKRGRAPKKRWQCVSRAPQIPSAWALLRRGAARFDGMALNDDAARDRGRKGALGRDVVESREFFGGDGDAIQAGLERALTASRCGCCCVMVRALQRRLPRLVPLRSPRSRGFEGKRTRTRAASFSRCVQEVDARSHEPQSKCVARRVAPQSGPPLAQHTPLALTGCAHDGTQNAADSKRAAIAHKLPPQAFKPLARGACLLNQGKGV
jgi:hypothetical protein